MPFLMTLIKFGQQNRLKTLAVEASVSQEDITWFDTLIRNYQEHQNLYKKEDEERIAQWFDNKTTKVAFTYLCQLGQQLESHQITPTADLILSAKKALPPAIFSQFHLIIDKEYKHGFQKLIDNFFAGTATLIDVQNYTHKLQRCSFTEKIYSEEEFSQDINRHDNFIGNHLKDIAILYAVEYQKAATTKDLHIFSQTYISLRQYSSLRDYCKDFIGIGIKPTRDIIIDLLQSLSPPPPAPTPGSSAAKISEYQDAQTAYKKNINDLHHVYVTKLGEHLNNYHKAFIKLQEIINNFKGNTNKSNIIKNDFISAIHSLQTEFNKVARALRQDNLSLNGFSYITEKDIPEVVVKTIIIGRLQFIIDFLFNPNEQTKNVFNEKGYEYENDFNPKAYADFHRELFKEKTVKLIDKENIVVDIEKIINERMITSSHIRPDSEEFIRTAATDIFQKFHPDNRRIHSLLSYLLVQKHYYIYQYLGMNPYAIAGGQASPGSFDTRIFVVKMEQDKIVCNIKLSVMPADCASFDYLNPQRETGIILSSPPETKPRLLIEVQYDIILSELPKITNIQIKMATIRRTPIFDFKILLPYWKKQSKRLEEADILYMYGEQLAYFFNLHNLCTDFHATTGLCSGDNRHGIIEWLAEIKHNPNYQNHYFETINKLFCDTYKGTISYVNCANTIISLVNQDKSLDKKQLFYLAQIGYGIILEYIVFTLEQQNTNARSLTEQQHQLIGNISTLLTRDSCQRPINNRLIELLKEISQKFPSIFNSRQLTLIQNAITIASDKNNVNIYFDKLALYFCGNNSQENKSYLLQGNTSLDTSTTTFIKNIVSSENPTSATSIGIAILKFTTSTLCTNKNDSVLLTHAAAVIIKKSIERPIIPDHKDLFPFVCQCILIYLNHNVFTVNSESTRALINITDNIKMPELLKRSIISILNHPVDEQQNLHRLVHIYRICHSQSEILKLRLVDNADSQIKQCQQFADTLKQTIDANIFKMVSNVLNTTANTGQSLNAYQQFFTVLMTCLVLHIKEGVTSDIILSSFQMKSENFKSFLQSLKLPPDITILIENIVIQANYNTYIDIVNAVFQFTNLVGYNKWSTFSASLQPITIFRNICGFGLLAKIVEQTTFDIDLKLELLSHEEILKIIVIYRNCKDALATIVTETAIHSLLNREFEALKKSLIKYISKCIGQFSSCHFDQDAVCAIINLDVQSFLLTSNLELSPLKLLHLYTSTDGRKEKPSADKKREVIYHALQKDTYRKKIFELRGVAIPGVDDNGITASLIISIMDKDYIETLLCDFKFVSLLSGDEIVTLLKFEPSLISAVLEGGGFRGNLPVVGDYKMNPLRDNLRESHIASLIATLEVFNPELASSTASTLSAPPRFFNVGSPLSLTPNSPTSTKIRELAARATQHSSSPRSFTSPPAASSSGLQPRRLNLGEKESPRAAVLNAAGISSSGARQYVNDADKVIAQNYYPSLPGEVNLALTSQTQSPHSIVPGSIFSESEEIAGRSRSHLTLNKGSTAGTEHNADRSGMPNGRP